MPIPSRETYGTDRQDLLVQITDDGSRTLLRQGTEDAFHSGCGAKSETRHVYLESTGVLDRLKAGESTSVLEVGLGTSMAMLMTVDVAIRNGTPLFYLALEKDWISSETLGFLRPNDWVEQTWLVESYLSFRESLPRHPSRGSYLWEVDQDRVVRVEIGDAISWRPLESILFDAIYFDPFCPESAPEFWTSEYLSLMRRLVRSSGRIATYSCSRPVRDAFGAAGWVVERIPGPPDGKREILRASLGTNSRSS